VVETIHARFPDHSILGEEGGAQRRSATHRWVIDPLDGTTNFVHGLPLYSVSIALEVDGRPVVGVVYDPNLDECFVA
jgi:myo-inositol-1(or 4)-monophosphatase